jgi:hypothetical protein
MSNKIDGETTDRVAWGSEPTWKAANLLQNESQNKMQLGHALDWYAYRSDSKEQKTWFLDYIGLNFPPDVKERLSILPDESFRPAGSLVRCAMRGAKIENLQKYVKDYIARFDELRRYLIKDQTIKVKKTQTRDVKVALIISELNDVLDIFITKRKPFLVEACDILTLNDASKTTKKEVIKYFAKTLSELESFLDKSDAEIIEGYGNFSRQQISKMVEFLKSLESYVPETDDEPKPEKIRKPRRKKVKSAEQVLRKFQYRRNGIHVKAVSVNPGSFLGQQQLIVFHEDKRVLGVFYAKDEKGLTVSGSSIRNYDEEKSFSKKIRKPEEVIPGVITGGKVAVRQLIDSVKTTPSVLRSSISEETLLLRIF